jgi:hypothetical protein
MSRSEPLAGPGPDAPAETGTPVSATVGSAAAIIGEGARTVPEGDDADVAMGGWATPTLGMGAGERFRDEGSMGGDCALKADGATVECVDLEGARDLLSPGGGVIGIPGSA